MSYYHSDKCTKEELSIFKKEVLEWLNDKFNINGMKIKAFTCYNGDVRVYTGDTNEYTNQKVTFRRVSPDIDSNGKIIGWNGTKGIHATKYVDYISINRDEFSEIKIAFDKKNDFYYDLIFRKLKSKQ